jgi:hypothetical protein
MSTLKLIIDGHPYTWAHQYITGEEVKKLGNLPLESDLYLSIREP